MLRQASVKNCKVLVVCVHDSILQPLILAISHKALATLEVPRAVHFSMTTIVRPECRILTNSVLHERTTVVHVRINDLATGPLICGEWRLVDMKNLIPRSKQMFTLQRFIERLNAVTDDILGADLAIIDRLKSL